MLEPKPVEAGGGEVLGKPVLGKPVLGNPVPWGNWAVRGKSLERGIPAGWGEPVC